MQSSAVTPKLCVLLQLCGCTHPKHFSISARAAYVLLHECGHTFPTRSPTAKGVPALRAPPQPCRATQLLHTNISARTSRVWLHISLAGCTRGSSIGFSMATHAGRWGACKRCCLLCARSCTAVLSPYMSTEHPAYSPIDPTCLHSSAGACIHCACRPTATRSPYCTQARMHGPCAFAHSHAHAPSACTRA